MKTIKAVDGDNLILVKCPDCKTDDVTFLVGEYDRDGYTEDYRCNKCGKDFAERTDCIGNEQDRDGWETVREAWESTSVYLEVSDPNATVATQIETFLLMYGDRKVAPRKG